MAPPWRKKTLRTSKTKGAIALLLAVFGFILVLEAGQTEAIDLSFLTKLFSPNDCPTRKDAIPYMEHLLKTRLIGQEFAYGIPHSILGHDKKKALTFHFAGDNGVGKTYATRLIAKALFTEVNNIGREKGLLHIKGELYRGDAPGDTAKFREQLRRRIVEQLSRCPFSVIVVDEAQYIHESTLSALKEFMDDPPFVTVDGYQVRTNEAIFIIVSDFGSEGMSYGMTKEQVQSRVYREMERLWSDPKQRDLIQYIVPFMPLREEHLRQITEMQLQDLSKADTVKEKGISAIEWEQQTLTEDTVPGFLASIARRWYAASFGRAVEKVVNSYVRDPLMAKLYSGDLPKYDSRREELVVFLRLNQKSQEPSIDVDIIRRPKTTKGRASTAGQDSNYWKFEL